jgi:hypothetical protein
MKSRRKNRDVGRLFAFYISGNKTKAMRILPDGYAGSVTDDVSMITDASRTCSSLCLS